MTNTKLWFPRKIHIRFVLFYFGLPGLRHIESSYGSNFTPIIFFFLSQFVFTIVLDSQQNWEVDMTSIVLTCLYKL